MKTPYLLYILASLLFLNTSIVHAKDDRLRCVDKGPGGREADLRFEIDDGDIEFRAKWEINLDQGQEPGDVVDVTIDGIFIGGIVLQLDGNQLEGDIELEGKSLPKGFPDIFEGSTTEIGALFCTFLED